MLSPISSVGTFDTSVLEWYVGFYHRGGYRKLCFLFMREYTLLHVESNITFPDLTPEKPFYTFHFAWCRNIRGLARISGLGFKENRILKFSLKVSPIIYPNIMQNNA